MAEIKDDKNKTAKTPAPAKAPAKDKEKSEKELLSEINMGILALSKRMDAMLEAMQFSQDNDDREPLEVAYPTDGGIKTLPAGSTTIDFIEGVVSLPGAAPEELEDNLKKRGGYIRSLTIEVQTLDMTISFDDRKATRLAVGRVVNFTNNNLLLTDKN